MTSTLSNLYVERASSEHPLALWMLNEKLDYVSQISEADRRFDLFAKWDIENAETLNEPIGSLDSPFIDSAVSRISGDVPALPEEIIYLRSKFSLSENLEDSFSNFSLGLYINPQTSLATEISFGYQYKDLNTLDIVEVMSTKVIKNIDRGTWLFFSDTFALPPQPSEAEDVVLLIKLTVIPGGIAGDYDFLINGLSLGQWSEDFNKESYGVIPEPVSTNINLPEFLKAIPAFPYGASGLNGFYLSNGYSLGAKNFGVPLVFGSSNVTKLLPNKVGNDYYPSLVFPGYGFLNQRGKNNTYTIEMWIKINSSSGEPRRIFGPITNTDGVYADGPFLTFKMGNNHGSHFVGEWFRPMLVHIRVNRNSAIMLLNGEEVVTLSFDNTTIDFPEEFMDGKSQDWLGFYSYEDLDPIDIDNFSIYSYAIPTEVAKKRWVWGQAVSAPEQTNSSLNSVTAFNDYAFADYAANYNYPDFANWKQAFVDNISAEDRILSFPEYQLPTFSLGSRIIQNLYNDIQQIDLDTDDPDDLAGRKYLTLKPKEDWDSPTDFIYFEKLGMLTGLVETVYGVFKTDGTEQNKTLIKIISKNNQDHFLIYISGTTLKYVVSINGISTTLATKTINPDIKFTVGFSIPKITKLSITGIQNLFSDQSSLQVYVAGDSVSKFEGKVYKVGFDSAYNSRKLLDKYDQDGIFLSTESVAESMYNHTANYTLVAIEKYDIFFSDIAVAGYWEDYMPLSYFSKSIIDYDGESAFELDSIQYNQDFPEPPARDSVEEISVWEYEDLRIKYTEPDILSYADLDNKFYTKWNDYQDMSENSIKTNFFVTETSTLRSFISFQPITGGANKTLIDFDNYAKPLTSGIIDPATVDQDWAETAFEITTGTVIYPPAKRYATNNNISFDDYAIVYHLDFKSDGILHHPIRFRELQLASHVLERTDFTKVGSRFGVPVFYYSKSGIYYDLKAKNPIATYKKSTPYLYLNRQSGWKLKGDFNSTVDRGLTTPVNQSRAENTEVASMQMWIRYAEIEFPDDPIMIFSIEHNRGDYDFYIQADQSLQRGYIFGVNRQTSEVLEDIGYYVNGNSVFRPFMVNEEWMVLGLEFPELLDFSLNTGKINLNGPLTYNNISYNLATNIEKDEVLEVRIWNDLQSTQLAGVSDVTSDGTEVRYTVTPGVGVILNYVEGEALSIRGILPDVFNVSGAVVKSISGNTITIDSSVTGTYVSGGVVTSGKWSDIQTDIMVPTGSQQPYNWQQVKIISQSRAFNINPKSIYEKYTGSDRIVIDDESRGIMVKPERLKFYSEVSWLDTLRVPA